MSTIVPKIKTRKRRIVRPEDRKNAKVSCDRCKIKKLACKRENPDSDGECLKCIKAGVECKTTIKRKKKARRPIENIGLHYKCLYGIVNGFFHDIDVNDIDALIDLGEAHGITMPSRFGQYDEDKDDNIQISIRLAGTTSLVKDEEEVTAVLTEDSVSTNSTEMERKIAVQDPNNSNEQEGLPSITAQDDNIESAMKVHDDFVQQDSIIIDQGGVCHYVGPFGAAGFLDSTVNLMVKLSVTESNLWNNYQKLFQSEIIISSEQEPLNYNTIKSSSPGFPFLDLLGRKEMDHYFNTFFSKIHPRFAIFDEDSTRSNYETFWMFTLLEVSNDKMLNSTEICCIYLIVVLGWMYEPFNNAESDDKEYLMDESIAQEYIGVVRCCIADMVLSPSLDGIRCMILLSIYMDNNKRRDTGYCLIELAARQAITIGLNRQSVTYCIDNDSLIQQMRMTWWTLFKMELVFSNQMGRSSCIQIEDIDIEYLQSGDPSFQFLFNLTIDLSKILYDILEYRKGISANLLSVQNIAKANALLERFKDWFQSFSNFNFPESELVNNMTLDILFRYHYYIMSLTLPILIAVTYSENLPNENVHQIIQECINSSIHMSNLLNLAESQNLFNGSVFHDVFFLYHASMTLVVAYIFVNKFKTSLPNTILIEITGSINVIKKINLKNSKRITGSNRKVSKFINILFNGLNIIQYIGADFILENSKTNKNLYKCPIIHMSNIADVNLRNSRIQFGKITSSPMLKPLDDELLKIFTADIENYKDIGSLVNI